MKLTGNQKLALLEAERLYESLYYDYCEEIESLADEEERDKKYADAETALKQFRQLIASI